MCHKLFYNIQSATEKCIFLQVYKKKLKNINKLTQSNIQIHYRKDFFCQKTLSRIGTKIQAVVGK